MKIERVLTKKLCHMGGREFGGCLTPSEILALPKLGARMNNPRDLDDAKERKALGRSEPWWVYFEWDRPAGR